MEKAMTAAEVEALRKQLAKDRTVMVDIIDHIQQLVVIPEARQELVANEESCAA